MDILHLICTVSGIAFAERRTRKPICAATAPATTACLTRAFCKFNDSSRSWHFEASHRHVDTLVQLPPISFNVRKRGAVDHIRLVTHGNVIRSYDMG
jgi:hypothetical protein